MSTDSKSIIQSNTIQAAAIVAVLGVLETNFSLLQNVLGQWYGLSYVVLSVLMVVLRMKTNKAIR